MSLSKRIFLLVALILLLSVGVETVFVTRHIQNVAIEEGRKKILAIAEKVARDPRIIDAFGRVDPSRVIQPIAETVRTTTGTSYVVVMNMDAIRYSHPEPDLIGRHFAGGDEKASLQGRVFISQMKGPLGVSQRAFVPIFAENKRQIGVVAVGLMITEIKKQQQRILFVLYPLAITSLLIGLAGAVWLARNIKQSIFGLEPHQIASLLEERNVILSSIREGVLAIDGEGRIILINDAARRILQLPELSENQRIAEVLPEDRLPLVVQSGRPIFDEEVVVKTAVVLVNRVPLLSGGRVIGAVATFRDMSEIRRLAEELTEVRKYIDALREQHHEHLNRLHVLSGLLQLKEYREALRFIVQTVSQTQKISDFLRARVKSPLVSGLLFAKVNEAKRLGIAVFIDPESSFPRISDEKTLSVVTIMGNLIENAMEALMRTEREDKRVFILLADRGDALEIVVRDNGGGIPEALKEQIFERGYTTKSSPKNMGMGLFIVRSEVERLKGVIELECEGGVEVVVRLPRQPLL